MGLFDKNVKRTGKGLFSQESSPYNNSESVQRQIDNARLRIQDSGYEAEDADKRNWLEKATNLPENQNWFFDTLELLGRPGQAVMNSIDKRDDGNVVSSAWKGFSGQERVRGTDLAEDMGVENKVGKFLLGTALEIGLDPTTYIPGGVIAKGLKGTANLAAKPLKAGYNALENASPALKTYRETVIQPFAEGTKDAFGYMLKTGYKADETLHGTKDDTLLTLSRETENSRKAMQEDVIRTVSGTAKAAGGLQTGEDVGRLLEASLKQFEDVKAYEFPDGLRRTEDKGELFATAATNREGIKEIGKEIRTIDRNYKSVLNQTTSELERVNKQLNRLYYTTERKKLKTLQSGQKPIEEKLGVRRGFTSKSPTINLLEQKRDELTSQLTELKNGMKTYRKKQYTPEQMQELATNRAFKSLSPSPAFNYLVQRRDELKSTIDGLREGVKVAKEKPIARIQGLVDENAALKEASRNPVMIQKEIERPVRDMPTDPKIQSAAKTLMDSNKAIRELAEENGIGISELEGYMTHVWSAEERARKKITKPVQIDVGAKGTGNPSKGLLKNRELPGSVEDINEKVGRKFFEPNAYYASAIGQKRLIDYVHAVKFRREVLSNPNFAIKYETGMSIPSNAVKIDTANYKFLKESDDLMEGAKLAEEIGGEYIVTKAAKELLDRYQHVNTDEGSKAFLKAFDTIQNFWKRAALFSVGYHVRNAAGAMFNNFVGGMDPASIVKFTKEATEEVRAASKGKGSKLFEEYRQQGLSSSTLSNVEFAKYGEEPEKAIERTIARQSATGKDKAKKLITSPFETSREIGDTMDQIHRFALYKWARNKGMSAEEAAAKVREVQFDYSDLTQFERKVRRVIPFYAWMRKNIPFQIRQFVNDPRKYAGANKLRLNAQDAVGIDENTMPDYMKESFAIPLTGDGQGRGKLLGLNLPIGDLTKLSNPGKTIVDSVSPLLKLIPELTLNRNFFYNKPIEKFEGQEKKYQLGPLNGSLSAKKAYALEQLTGQIGRGLSGYLTKPEQADQDTKFRRPSLGLSIIKEYDTSKAKYFELREELKKLQDYINYIEQQTGIRPREVKEIKK